MVDAQGLAFEVRPVGDNIELPRLHDGTMRRLRRRTIDSPGDTAWSDELRVPELSAALSRGAVEPTGNTRGAFCVLGEQATATDAIEIPLASGLVLRVSAGQCIQSFEMRADDWRKALRDRLLVAVG